MFLKNANKIYVVLIIFLFSFFFFLNYDLNSFQISDDAGRYFYAGVDYYTNFYAWNAYTGHGGIGTNGVNIVMVPFLVIVHLLKLVFGGLIAQNIFAYIKFILLPLSFWILSSLFTKNYNIRFATTLFYSLNMILMRNWLRNILFIDLLYVCTPVLIYLIVKYLQSFNKKYLVGLFVLSLINSILILNPAYFLMQLITINIIIFIIFIKNFNTKFIREVIIVNFIVYVFVIFSFSSHFLFYLNKENLVADSYSSEVITTQLNVQEKNNSLLNLFRFYNADILSSYGTFNSMPFYPSETLVNLKDSIIGITFSFLPLIILICILIGVSKKRRFKLIPYFIVILISFFIIKSSAPPWGQVFRGLIEGGSLFTIFRNPQQKFGYILVLTLSVVFIIGLNSLRKRKYFLLTTLISLAVYSFIFATPILKGKLFTPYSFSYPPSYYLDMANYINSNEDINNIYSFPINNSDFQYLNFGYEGFNLFKFLSPYKSIFERKSEAFSLANKTTNNAIRLVMEESPSDIGKVMMLNHIDTIIFHKDYNFTRMGREDRTEYELSVIKKQDMLYLDKEFGELSLYRLKEEHLAPHIDTFSSLISLSNKKQLVNKYDFITKKLEKDFYFISEVGERKINYPLVRVIELFDNFIIKNKSVAENVVLITEKNKLHINYNSSNLRNYLNLNHKRISEGDFDISTEQNIFEYKNPRYDFKNLISNGSFESGFWQEKVGDCNNHDNNPILAMSLNTEEKSGGNQSLQLEATRHVACTRIKISVNPGATYLFNFDYQSPNAKYATYYFEFNNKTKISEDIPVTNLGWNSFSKTIRIPDGASEVFLHIYADSVDEKINIINRYDNFQLIEIPDLSDAYYLVSEPEIELVEPREITFNLINPTKKTVQIRGATTSFYLAMSESYHPQWQLQFDNDKIHGFFDSWVPFVKPDRIDEEYHYKLNDFLNGWYIDVEKYCGEGNLCIKNEDGSYDINMVIEFFPQRWFYLGLLISGTTFAGCVGYLGYHGVQSVRRRLKKKHEKTK